MGCTSVAQFPLEENVSKALEIHNQKRACHRSPDLLINKDLNKLAQEYAEQLAKKQESIKINLYNNEFLGENIYIYKGKDFSAENMCNAWYEEIKKFDKSSLQYQKNTSHFTQMIWKGSKEVGFGFKNRGKNYYGVAFYYPPGNTLGEYKDNIVFSS